MSTFEEYFADVIRRSSLPPRLLLDNEWRSRAGRRCTICHAGRLEYPHEVAL